MPGPGADPLSGPGATGPAAWPVVLPAAGHAGVQVLGPRRWSDLGPATAYAIVRLRVDVFVVEQSCPYPELDGRDVEPATEHRWVAGSGGPPLPGGGDAVLAYLRVLSEPDGSRRVGRVVTAADVRGRGLAARLVAAAVADHGGGPMVLDAQSPLQGWYARFGFAADGPGFVEDGIPHVPMRRAPTP